MITLYIFFERFEEKKISTLFISFNLILWQISNSSQFQTLTSRYYDITADDATLFSFDGLLFNGLTKEWHLGSMNEHHHYRLARYKSQLDQQAIQSALEKSRQILRN